MASKSKLTVLLLFLGLCSIHAEADDFQDAYGRFYEPPPKELDPRWLGEKVDEVKRLAREFPDHPDLPKLMFGLANYAEIPGYFDLETAIAWYRQTADTADPGSEYWFRALSRLAGEPYRKNLEETARLIDEMADHIDPFDTASRVKIETARYHLAVDQGNWELALVHAHRVMDWYDIDPEKNYKPTESDLRVRSAVDTEIRTMASSVVSHYANNSELTFAERIKGIREAMAKQPLLRPMQDFGNRELKKLRHQLDDQVRKEIDRSMAHLLNLPVEQSTATSSPRTAATTNIRTTRPLVMDSSNISSNPSADLSSGTPSTSSVVNKWWWLITLLPIGAILFWQYRSRLKQSPGPLPQ